ncbi:MAG: two-component sensor histidine kinase, partial [Hyphomicrobiales bacterium]|nr:two-component sensor histidine kinase [Hyphomicrobiales bacterium]
MPADADLAAIADSAAFAEALPDAIALVGRDLRTLVANAAARALFPALRVGAPLALGLRAPDALDACARALATG